MAMSDSMCLIGVRGKIIQCEDELLTLLSEIIENNSIYQCSKYKLNRNTLYNIKQGNLKDPRLSTVLKLLKAGNKKIIIVDNI